MASSMNFNVPVAYPETVVRLNFAERKNRDLVDHGYGTLRFQTVSIAKLGGKDRDL